MPTIHPTADISPEADIADDVTIGPGCVINGHVRLAPGVRLMGNIYLTGRVSVGEDSVLYPFSCIGFPPQHRRFGPDDPSAGVSIGKRAVIREHVTVHSATNTDTPTTLGDDIYMMVGSHLAHDCQVGDRVTMVNGAGMAGHVNIGDDVTFGGYAAVHQFCRVGRMVMVRAGACSNLDIPPFCTLQEDNRIGGINVVGLRRADVPRDEITSLRRAYRQVLHTPMPRQEAIAMLREVQHESPLITELIDFIASSERGITPGMARGVRGTTSRQDGVPADSTES